MTAPVKWLGHSAVYTTDERAILAALPVREQAFLHTLKAFTEGEIFEARVTVPDDVPAGKERSAELGVRGAGETSSQAAIPTNCDRTAAEKEEESARPTSAPPTVYTDAEDIEFGVRGPRQGILRGTFGAGAQTSRKRPVYALCWTWRHSRVLKTKRECIEKQRVWKKWYERQGWKVSSHATGYFARHPSGQSHSISLHEYDPVTKERLR